MLFRVPKRAITRSTLFITGSQSLPCIRQPFLSIYKSFSTSAGRLRRQSDKLARNALGFDNDVSFETLKPNARYHVAFLRDSCACPRCVDPSTTQKLFETADIPESIKVKSAETNADGSITVEWENDMDGYENHFSTYPDHFFIDNSSIASRLQSTFNCKIGHRWFWDQHIVASRRSTIDYTEFVGSPAVLFSALQCLQTYGLIFLGNVPSKPDAIIEIANRIGPIRNTFYGPVWDVRSVPSAKNVAYTSSNLGFHMDLLYMEDPPGLQILHCLKASEKGGGNLFSDTFAAVTTMKRHWHHLFLSLMKFPITFRYRNDGVNYQHSKPTVEMFRSPASYDTDGLFNSTSQPIIKAVNWSPPFQAPLLLDIGSGPNAGSSKNSLSVYINAAKVFKRLVEDPASVYETKMEEGSCVIFNNRRVVHARRAFEDTEAEGKRWLRGAYVDTDAFNSRLRTLEEDQTRGKF